MLSYDEFKEAFCAQFPKAMGKEYKGYEVKPIPVKKRGRSLDGFTFSPKSGDGSIRAMPTYYFDDLYKTYCVEEDLSSCIEGVAGSMKCAIGKSQSLTANVDLANIRKNVIAELVNPEVSDRYIHDVPHREFLNLCIIYRWVVSIDEEGVYSGIIDNELMGYVNLTEESLYKNAIRNTKRIIAPQLKSFDSVIRRMLRRSGKSDKEIREFVGRIDNEDRIWVITNKHDFRASTALIYKDFLIKIADKMDSDFYIIPTSVNESLAVSANSSLVPEAMYGMLKDSNNNFLEDEDQMLSDTVYYFDRNKEELMVCAVGEVSV